MWGTFFLSSFVLACSSVKFIFNVVQDYDLESDFSPRHKCFTMKVKLKHYIIQQQMIIIQNHNDHFDEAMLIFPCLKKT